ncbi:hypothetical protein ACFPPD_24735 [Cohnella suwonensis]|uniref:DUF4083 domain-containing protein n=1 Tax=Cohnella suwonensis TaxID=696072 RepID=A0ABW0M1K4_9BACL
MTILFSRNGIENKIIHFLEEGENMNFYVVLFMILVLMGLGSIHHELRKRIINDEKVIDRLDLIIKELRSQNDNTPNS